MAELGNSAKRGRGAERGAMPCRHEGLGFLPEFFRQAAGCHLTAKGALQPQPAVQALAAQLPAGQHRLHPGDGACGLLEGSIKEAKGQQHPGPSQGRTVLGGGEAAQAGAGKALGQLKAARTTEFQAVAAATGGQAQPRGPIPEEAKSISLAATSLAAISLAVSAGIEMGQ